MKLTTLAVAAALVAINCLGYFVFPGHTYLTSDTQIYLPMLERLWDPAQLGKDLIATNPHLSYTIYDELAIAGRKISGLGFDQVLPALHFTFRMAGVWGIWLIFRAWGFSAVLSLLATAIYGLGAFVHGPAVMTWELEPVPRTMALPLLWLSIGLIAGQRPKWAAVAAGLAFLIHPPTVWPVWAILGLLIVFPTDDALRRARWHMLATLLASIVVLFVASRFQAGEHEKQHFLATLDPTLESLQRMRASYNWVGTWASIWWKKYLLLFVASLIAAKSLRVLAPRSLSWFHVGLTLLGAASVGFSYLLLDLGKWALVPQVQFGRALQFVIAWALLGALACGIRAVVKRNYVSAVLWFYLAYGVPVQVQTWELLAPWSKEVTRLNLSLIFGLAIAATLAVYLSLKQGTAQQWAGTIVVAVVAVSGFFALLEIGKITTHPKVHTADLADLTRWARQSTPIDAVFHFPDAKQELFPGIFRGNSARAIYVDWKSGGQVNFHKQLADEWWSRWQATLGKGYNSQPIQNYATIADFVVLRVKNRIPEIPAAYENSTYLVYQVPR